MDGVSRSNLKKRILFVDDEPAILMGLESLLRRDRARWEMVFALGGRSALMEVSSGVFDAVVSDMRMPEVNGAMLLEVIQRRSPLTARILLVGHADSAEITRALPFVHEFLTKPYRVASIREAIERLLNFEKRTARIGSPNHAS